MTLLWLSSGTEGPSTLGPTRRCLSGLTPPVGQQSNTPVGRDFRSWAVFPPARHPRTPLARFLSILGHPGTSGVHLLVMSVSLWPLNDMFGRIGCKIASSLACKRPDHRAIKSRAIVSCQIARHCATFLAMGQTIVFANSKGGVGKSMLAVHLAVWLHDQGYHVALLDADPQATASTWMTRIPRQDVTPFSPSAADETAKADEVLLAIDRLCTDHDFVVVDTQGSATLTTSAAMIKADLALIPLQPSAADLWPIEQALATVHLSQQARRGKPRALIVLNQTSPNDVVARSARHSAAQHNLPIADTSIPRLHAYRDAPANASVATRLTHYRGRRAAAPLVRLFNEVLFGCRPGLNGQPAYERQANSCR